MKYIYDEPSQQIVTFEPKDIITTSQTPGMNDAGVGSWGAEDSVDLNDILGKK